jgi:succinate-semialdehyde dehydrogenase/glutarate-semialdehyde dehydrogenase/succinyl-CoA reductase
LKSRSIIEDKNLIKTINPSTEEVLNQYEIISKEEINDITRKAKNKFAEWKVDINKRIDFLHDFPDEFRKNKDNLAKIATTEMGKVIKESKSEVEKCAWVIEYFADNGEIFIKDEVVNTDARKSIISFQPLGAIASIMPWNYPYWQALRFAAPSLIVGNTIVLKPASATMQCGIEIENTFKKLAYQMEYFKHWLATLLLQKHSLILMVSLQ